MAVTVEIKSEKAISSDPARIIIYQDGKILEIITAKIKFQRGADGGCYPCVILEKQK